MASARLGVERGVERGAVMFLAAMMILIVLIGGAIAVDLSITATRGQSLQNAADSAALAGVQALRESMGADIVATADDQQAARDAIENLLRQNGITDITPQVEFPDAGAGDTEVRVTLLDNDPGLLLTGVTGVDGSVENYLEAVWRDQRLWVTVTVEAEGDPWADGDQKFTVEFERTPRLTD